MLTLVKIFGIFILAIMLLWSMGFFLFAGQIPSAVNNTRYPNADAIVVLTGGGARLEAGVSLLKNGYADKLFISGVKKGVGLKTLLLSCGLTKAEALEIIAGKNVMLGFDASSTHGNAVEVADWIKTNDYNKIYLVTASYHIPRSLFEFRAAMPDKIFYPYPVFPEDFKSGEWFRHYSSLRLAWSEYNKYLVARLRIWFSDVLELKL